MPRIQSDDNKKCNIQSSPSSWTIAKRRVQTFSQVLHKTNFQRHLMNKTFVTGVHFFISIQNLLVQCVFAVSPSSAKLVTMFRKPKNVVFITSLFLLDSLSFLYTVVVLSVIGHTFGTGDIRKSNRTMFLDYSYLIFRTPRHLPM